MRINKYIDERFRERAQSLIKDIENARLHHVLKIDSETVRVVYMIGAETTWNIILFSI